MRSCQRHSDFEGTANYDGPYYYCKMVEAVTGESTLVNALVCEDCQEKAEHYQGMAKRSLRARVASANTDLDKWSAKLLDYAGEDELKDVLTVAAKKGNRTAEDIVGVADKLKLKD